MSVNITGLATALPEHRLPQAPLRAAARDLYGGRVAGYDRLESVFETSEVRERASVVPLDWFPRAGGWAEKQAIFRAVAPALLEDATRRALAEAGVAAEDVAGVVAVTSTGVTTPTLDALMLDRLGLSPTIRRMPLFGLGCVGGAIGLSHAADLARAVEGRPVLLLVVEACTLAFRLEDADKAAVVAASLFGDGAAAAVIQDRPDGPMLGVGGSHTWPGSLDVMGWRVEDDGLGVIFAGSIPALVRRDLRVAVEAFMGSQGRAPRDLAGLICHPGGPKVLDAIAEALPEADDGFPEARGVLRDHGNMSSATVLFVLDRMRRSGRSGEYLLTALGPGFTAGFLPVVL